MTERISITEEQGVHKNWYEEAKTQKPETIEAFIKRLVNDYNHDYGTICHAMAAAAIGAANAVNHSEQGGISGFQAGAVFWEFEKAWGIFLEGPKRMVCYMDLLYPQCVYRVTTITKSTHDWLISEARKKLASSFFASPTVREHWEKVSKGFIPEGITIRD